MVSQSEVAQLKQRIEQECEAMQRGLTGFATLGAHKIIHQRYQNIEVAEQELAQHVGAEEAKQFMVETYTRTMG